MKKKLQWKILETSPPSFNGRSLRMLKADPRAFPAMAVLEMMFV
jgi:hypothetical protein